MFNANIMWDFIGYIGSVQTDHPRNHNPGILTNKYGYVKDNSTITIYFTSSVINSDWLWSYDVYSAKFNLGN